MTGLFKAYCRIYQKVFYVCSYLLGFREPEVISGENSILKLPGFIKEKGINSVLIVTDAGILGLGLVDGLIDGLKKEGINYSVYSKVVPNPTIDNIEEAYAQYLKNKHEALIAFGGGSPMDCAKGVGARSVNPKRSIPQMKGLLKVGHKIPTLFAIPTTAGTGSETTVAAVVTNSKTHEKYPLNDPKLIPAYAILDPVVTVKLPKHITSTTGMDALTHAVEAFIGSSNTANTKRQAIEATKLIFENVKVAYDEPENIQARNNMQIAAYKAGVAFTRAYVGNVHAIAHTLGGMYGVPHGLANAVILPYVLDWYGETAYKKLAILAREVGIEGNSDEELAKNFVKAIRDYNKYMNIPDKIEGIKEEDLETMITRAQSEANPLYPVPRIMSREDMKDMYHTIMK